jgi:DNA-binding transcriptional MerR regulator
MGQNEPIRGNAHPAGPRGPVSEIPDKLYFRIGEVARLCDVPAYVLRFWESEFPQLKPNKGGTGQRLYRRRDVEMALRVKRLLYEEGYTIPGARQLLKSELRHKEPQLPLAGAGLPDAKQLHSLRRELEAIAAILSHPVGKSPHVNASAIHPIRSQRRAAPRASTRVNAPAIPFDDSEADRK